MQARPPRICRKWNPALPAGSGAGSPGLSKPAGLRPVPVEKRRHDVPASVERTPGSAEKRPAFVEYHARTCRGFTRNCRKHFQNGTGLQQVMPLQAAVYTLYVLFFLCRTSIYLFIDSFKKRVIRLYFMAMAGATVCLCRSTCFRQIGVFFTAFPPFSTNAYVLYGRMCACAHVTPAFSTNPDVPGSASRHGGKEKPPRTGQVSRRLGRLILPPCNVRRPRTLTPSCGTSGRLYRARRHPACTPKSLCRQRPGRPCRRTTACNGMRS